MGDAHIDALRAVDLDVSRNEYLAIMGQSGSGKSTLMNIIGCLDRPTAGEYWLNGERVSTMNDRQLARIRNREIGFIFQTFNLLPRMTALANVEVPLVYSGMKKKQRIEMATNALERVGHAQQEGHDDDRHQPELLAHAHEVPEFGKERHLWVLSRQNWLVIDPGSVVSPARRIQ